MYTTNSAKIQVWRVTKRLVVFMFGLWLLLAPLARVSAEEGWLAIENGKSIIKQREVTLFLIPPAEYVEMKISNNLVLNDAAWEPVKSQKIWWLDYGTGIKTVYAKFRDKKGNVTELMKDTIILSLPKATSANFFINQDAKTTIERAVTLSLVYTEGVEWVAFSNNSDFSTAEFVPVQKIFSWILPPGGGEKTVYAQFKDALGEVKKFNKKITYKQPERYIPEGSLLKGQTDSVYYFGFDGKIHPFPNAAVYHSWYKDFASVTHISNSKLAEYQVGEPVCLRPGTWLLRFSAGATIYAVEPGCGLRPLLSETEAYILYGPSWAERIITLNVAHSGFYKIKSFSIADPKKDIVDKDGDGLDKGAEKKYGSSDGKLDSDNDGLSDREEVLYWFSDPKKKDTDDDGFADGGEIKQGFSPVGVGPIKAIPNGTYEHAPGALIYKSGQYYYRHSNGNTYFVGKKISDKKFTSNKFDPLFVINPPLSMTLPSLAKGTVGSALTETISPTKTINKKIVEL